MQDQISDTIYSRGIFRRNSPSEIRRNSRRSSGVFSERTAEKFPVELCKYFRGTAGGTLKECIEEFLKKLYRNSPKEFSEKVLRNSWRNPRRISGETKKELLKEFLRNCWMNHEENLREFSEELCKNSWKIKNI